MTAFLWVVFVLFVFENAYLVYNYIVKKPLKQELAEARAQLKVSGVVNELLNKELADTPSGRVNQLNSTNE
jgi:hypothetical protein